MEEKSINCQDKDVSLLENIANRRVKRKFRKPQGDKIKYESINKG